ncbi:hypothetical protein [Psychroflexus montanilacus]|uniref:hypothetical protein n=1 Tax=Psychroflexus montanilacus TaxID=2873598 RepID=UPI001CCB2119|nr:hypothetical protein [Psychroflexus montanilacus]MBZ9652662.1 hypothetical protein [Psychroflexus montanilacus]
MDWTKIFSEIGIFGIISGLIVWLIKQLGQRYIDKGAKTHEQKLQNQSDLYKAELNQSLEKFKSEIAFFSQKAFKLHDKRLERIENLYSLLTNFYEDMFHLTTWKVVTGMTDDDVNRQNFENTKKAGKSGTNFFKYYARNKLYFDKDTCKLIEEIIKLLKDSHFDFSYEYVFGPMSADFKFETVKKATEKIREKVPEIKSELEDNFRKIIGVYE